MDADTGVVRLDSLAAFKAQACVLLRAAVREIKIVSFDLELPLYGDSEVFSRLKAFSTGHRNSKIDIILATDKELVGAGHPVLDLSRRMTSTIQIQVVDPAYVESNKSFASFLLIDRSGVLYRPDSSVYIGFSHANDIATAVRLREQYDELDRLSKPSREAKRLYL
ncbi:hypothetical protein [Gynuella sunshinyii]|uniref:DUF7931 domain-containing protein n=1 Tax=Gynuella sunshinyii YC6258 TaxID=1445510 RepID=A0A0C5VJD1_9GAMM|nr:hypothetical protein [Gynuella sunshinyii]AJQ94386.1 hypothetical Protein YC6258_02348 [Gynuella sunshinyii YC6258]